MKGIVYILQDDEKRFYIGSTTDLVRRFKQHESGHTQTTSKMKNLKIVMFQEYASLEQARKIERRIKYLKRKDYVEKIIKDGYIKMKI